MKRAKREGRSLVTIAKADDFDFREYLKHLKEVEGLKVTKTNERDHAEFILEGNGTLFVPIWNLDSYKIKSEGYIEVTRSGDKVELYYGCRIARDYWRNRNMLMLISSMIMFAIAAFLILAVPWPPLHSFCLIITFIVIFATGIPFAYYSSSKYENIGLNNQLYSFKRRLLRGTLADEGGSWNSLWGERR